MPVSYLPTIRPELLLGFAAQTLKCGSQARLAWEAEDITSSVEASHEWPGNTEVQ
jgi:hypothetical protein